MGRMSVTGIFQLLRVARLTIQPLVRDKSAMSAALLICLSLLALPAAQSQTESARQRPAEVTQLIAKLPECSRLREQLEHGRFSDGTGKPYMRPMLDHGVQRAFFEVEGNWSHGRAENIRFVRRLYYRILDGPDAQITDAATLNEIETSGLAGTLDQAVLPQIKNAHLFSGTDQWGTAGIAGYWKWRLKGGHIYGTADLFASPWVSPFAGDIVSPYKVRDDLTHVAQIGDVIGVSKLLSAKRYSQLDLNRALNCAVMSLWDNTNVINMLVKAGADVNAKSSDGTTPLMATYECACNISVLLANGARVEDRNRFGQTALDFARQRHDAVALRLLEGAKRHPATAAVR